MGKLNLNFSLISFHIFLFSLFTLHNLIITATSTDESIPNPFQGIECSVLNCGEGTCVSSNASLIGIDCDCKPGWKKIQFGSFYLPPCVLPNCTVDFSCGNVSSPPPPPAFPPSNLSDPCALVWCGDGSCTANGTGHTCHCYSGSENLLDNSAFPCLQQCSLGADCNGLGLDLSAPPPPSKSGSPPNGPTQATNNSSKLGALTIILLVAATIQTWF